MAGNSSQGGGEGLLMQARERLILVQLLVLVFLFINCMLLVTFFSKAYFYTTMRYILFAVTVLSDNLILILSNILLIVNYSNFKMNIASCLTLYTTLGVCNFVTPVTLTAMALERYVAICKPLRHGALCSTRSALHCILVIHSLGSVPITVILSIFFATAPHSVYTQRRLCTMSLFVFLRWQDNVKFAVYQFYFLVMTATITFSYVKIIKVARVASGEDKKSSRRGLSTLLLHSFQLLLCLIQLWFPFIENAVFRINLKLYIDLRYFDYIFLYLAPRCLSPLIYGLRDTKVCLALKHNALFVCRRRTTLML